VFQVIADVVPVEEAATLLITGSEVLAVEVAVLEAVTKVISLDVAMVPEALLDSTWK
jgi:hypothetical protein